MASGEQIEQLLRDLGKAFSQVMSTSSEVVAVVKRLQKQGYDLSLSVDHTQSPELKARIALCLEPRPAQGTPPKLEQPSASPKPAAGTFRIESADVALLRSLGIDATRKGRRKK